MAFGIFIIVLLLLVVIYLSLDKITETINKCIVYFNNTIEESNKRKEEKKKSAIKSLEKSKQQEQSNSTPKNVVEYGDIDSAISDLKKIKKKIKETTKVPSDKIDGRTDSVSKKNKGSSGLSSNYTVKFIDDDELGYKIVTDFGDVWHTDSYDDVHLQKRRRDEMSERWNRVVMGLDNNDVDF